MPRAPMYTKNNLPTALRPRYVPYTMSTRNGPSPSPVPPSAANEPGQPAPEPPPQPGGPAPAVPAEPGPVPAPPSGPIPAPASSTPVTVTPAKEPRPQRFLFISKWGLIHDLAWELRKEGS